MSQPLIARTWHGQTDAVRADEYLEYLFKTGMPEYKATDGNRGITVLRRIECDIAHFLIITYWESLESIKRFAGEDYEKAKYYPEDLHFLHELEPKVTHYETLAVL